MKDTNYTIKTASSSVFIGNTILQHLREFMTSFQTHKKFLLVDENALQHCVPILLSEVDALKDVEIIEIESGEANKTLDVCYQIWKTLLEYKANRNALIINLGGGVICDMGGFIASTYQRGIKYINIPTTLLAQIDASVGGKVGVDFEGLKNMIGLFNEPEAVFIYPDFLKTLSKQQLLSGYAEALKCALIKDKAYWDFLKVNVLHDNSKWLDLIHKAISIKNNIVLQDPMELGERKLLNFGHTIGHAVESYALKNEAIALLHGEAIAIGIICETYISHKQHQLSVDILDEITSTILELYPKYELDPENFDALIQLMKHDKKNKSDKINFTLLKNIGEGTVDMEVPVEWILDALTYYITIATTKQTSIH